MTDNAALRYYGDFRVGEEIELGTSGAVSEAAIIDFARRFDPQPFHVDLHAASESIFGGLVASGWHTCGLFMRLLVDGLLSRAHSMGSPGVEELRWPLPVRPGDTLSGRITVMAMRESAGRPEMGIIRWRGEGRNQRSELVLSMAGVNFFRRRG